MMIIKTLVYQIVFKSMKQIFRLLICLTFLSPVIAQDVEDSSEKRALERDVKTSGDYLYGEAVHANKKEAEKIAKTMLISEINKEALTRPDWQFAKKLEANNVSTEVEQIELPRGSRYRVIAFIKKDNVVAVFDKKDQEVVITTSQNEKQNSGNNETKTTVNQTKAPVSQPGASAEPKIIIPAPTDNTILEDFLKVQNAKEAGELLTKYRKQGKLVYGKPDQEPTPEKSYWIVYNRSGNILGIIDKGSNNKRVNLLTGQQVEARTFASNNYLWFQLLD